MKIAVIGSGISGLSAAWLLSSAHQVTLFEANAYLGGHTNTVDVTLDGIAHPVDTGFLVYNDRTYPNLIALFEALGVRSAESDMSFSVQVEAERLEWAGNNLASVFAQKRNLLRPKFLGMLKDILRFNREATALLTSGDPVEGTLGEYLQLCRFSGAFREWYLLPMAASIWSATPSEILRFPLATFLRFCHNHGLLQINDRPQWRTVIGGARDYVQRMARTIDDIRLNAPIAAVTRGPDFVTLRPSHGEPEYFDHVILACHSDQALAMLADADGHERGLLAAIRYQPNTAILHTDASFLPSNKIAYAAWNYHAGFGEASDRPASVTYLINKLQPLPFSTPVMVTLNPQREPTAENVIQRFNYSHPIFDQAAVAAQKKLDTIQGERNVWFCGAWTRYGFHEDGLQSGIHVASLLGSVAPWVKQHRQKQNGLIPIYA
jgi:uncharacterized protein